MTNRNDRDLTSQTAEVMAYLQELDLQHALWWFIENESNAPWRNGVFFYLRDRIKTRGSECSTVGIGVASR